MPQSTGNTCFERGVMHDRVTRRSLGGTPSAKILKTLTLNTAFLSVAYCMFSASYVYCADSVVLCWSKLDGTVRFRESNVSKDVQPGLAELTISIDDKVQMQAIDGFGFCLTQGSAWVMRHKMSDAQRAQLLKELFTTAEGGIGVSALRIAIGASDLSTHVYTYADSPTADQSLSNFSLGEDLEDVVPVLKEILSIAPGLKIMASPWTPPVWMKTSNDAKGGSLKKEYYSLYAQYFIQYLQAMESQRIPIFAVTIQNEPENPHNTPSLSMTAAEQCAFVRDHLGPAMTKSNRKERIVIFDHNCDHPEYPIEILSDPVAASFIDGSAFHLYAGDVSALGKVHDRFPNKSIYFTEQWLSSEGSFGPDLHWHAENVLIGATNHWAKMVLEWNLASDEKMEPHTQGGCDKCLGAVTIQNGTVTRNASYYAIGHASRFVPSGSVRIQSSHPASIRNVAFLTPDRRHVLIVLNPSDKPQSLRIKYGVDAIDVLLESNSLSTVSW